MSVTRFAPSPTGLLHLGHAFAALTARAAGERFLLRVEDIDATRVRPEFEAAIFEDLAWLELDWAKPVLRQSERFDAYRDALASLRARGLLYPCFCTRRQIADEIMRASEAPHGPEGPRYPGTCRQVTERERRYRIADGVPYVLRLNSIAAAAANVDLKFEERGLGPNGEHGMIAVDPTRFGDVVLSRKETPAAYHLAVVVDDAFQGVDLVTRGNDLFAATHVQRLLQTLLNLPAPNYAHHRLILDEHGQKFSKRDHAVTLRSLRQGGTTREQVRERIGIAMRR